MRGVIPKFLGAWTLIALLLMSGCRMPTGKDLDSYFALNIRGMPGQAAFRVEWSGAVALQVTREENGEKTVKNLALSDDQIIDLRTLVVNIINSPPKTERPNIQDGTKIAAVLRKGSDERKIRFGAMGSVDDAPKPVRTFVGIVNAMLPEKERIW